MPANPQHTFFACVTTTVLYTGVEIKDALLCRTVRHHGYPGDGRKPLFRLRGTAPGRGFFVSRWGSTRKGKGAWKKDG